GMLGLRSRPRGTAARFAHALLHLRQNRARGCLLFRRQLLPDSLLIGGLLRRRRFELLELLTRLGIGLPAAFARGAHLLLQLSHLLAMRGLELALGSLELGDDGCDVLVLRL